MTLQAIITKLIDTILNPAINILLGVAMLVFFYGIVKYLYSVAQGEKTASKAILYWGVISLAVMVSVWGIVKLLQDTFLGSAGGITSPPSIPRFQIGTQQTNESGNRPDVRAD